MHFLDFKVINILNPVKGYTIKYYVSRCIYNLSYTWCTDEDDVPSTLKLSPLLTGLGWPPLLPPLFSGRRGPPPTPLLVIMSNAVNGNNNSYYTSTVFIVYSIRVVAEKRFTQEYYTHCAPAKRKTTDCEDDDDDCDCGAFIDAYSTRMAEPSPPSIKFIERTSGPGRLPTRAQRILIHDTYDGDVRTRIRPTAVIVQYVYVTINKYVFFFFLIFHRA